MFSYATNCDQFVYEDKVIEWKDLPEAARCVGGEWYNNYHHRYFFVAADNRPVVYSSDTNIGFKNSLPFGSWFYVAKMSYSTYMLPDFLRSNINYFFRNVSQMQELKEIVMMRTYPTFTRSIPIELHQVDLSQLGPYPRMVNELVIKTELSREIIVRAVSRDKRFVLSLPKKKGPLWIIERHVTIRIVQLREICSSCRETILELSRPFSEEEMWELCLHAFRVEIIGLCRYRVFNQLEPNGDIRYYRE